MSNTATPAFAVDRAAFVQRDRQRRLSAHNACQNVLPLFDSMLHSLTSARIAAATDLDGMTRAHLKELAGQVDAALKALPEV